MLCYTLTCIKGVETVVTYKEELYTEIRKRLTRLAVIVSMVIVLLLALLFLFIENYQLKYDTQQVVTFFKELDKKGEQVLHDINQSVVPSYLEGNNNERKLYADYYKILNDTDLTADLLVINKKGETAVSIGQSPVFLSPFYLKEMCLETGDTIKKIQRGMNGSMYFLLSRRIEKSDFYSILVIDSHIFNQMGIQFGTNYAIADQLDNVLVSNRPDFIESHKLNHQWLMYPFFFKGGNLYLSKLTTINASTTLYTYIITFPLIYFILFSFIVTSALFYLLWHQSERLAQGIASKQTQDINQLVAETMRLKKGNNYPIKLKTNREFQFLIDNINNMVEERDKLLQQQIILERQNFSYERKVLEAQFNPHFIYNTLEAIRVTSHFDPGITDRLILSLNRVLRYSVDFSSDHACLGKDTQIIKDFLEVNFIRFENFSYDIVVDDELMSFPVPKLFLLPLVENAIKYGMKVRQDLSISIRCYRVNDEIYFEVSDNGPGFTREKIETIHQIKEEGTQHGLVNSYRRLKHLYPNSSLTISNQKEGATVKFSVWGIENGHNSCS